MGTLKMLTKLAMFLILLGTFSSDAQITQLYAPNEMSSGRTTLSFDEFGDYVPVNTAYQNLGITFGRDDGGYVPVWDVRGYGVAYPSSNNILFSGFFPLIGPTQAYTTHITMSSLQPLNEIGGIFGNDGEIGSFGFERMSIFGATNEFLGSIDVTVNNNRDLDQFIGLRSSVPFYHVRFENFTPSGIVSDGHGVALDDLNFTIVPEPTPLVLGVVGVGLWFFARRRRAWN